MFAQGIPKVRRQRKSHCFVLKFKHFQGVHLERGQNLSRCGRNVICKVVIAMRTLFVGHEIPYFLILRKEIFVANDFARSNAAEYVRQAFEIVLARVFVNVEFACGNVSPCDTERVCV